ncbi:hypothetical protein WA026_020578 [Henosepilachna vigintioctopunctata]|uniref:Zinc transporter ZIP11 n=1 Tax=Henosepilachna vigintioctopunctata TaxID=420089 RepID=A0AAW1V4C2_9CUCU
MIRGYGPVMQAFLGTLFTWGLTAAGAAVVIIFQGSQRKLLDVSLGFAAGVMTAASFWSLLSPAIEMAVESKLYGLNGEYAFAPVGLGFFFGALFVFGTDVLITHMGISSPNVMLALNNSSVTRKERRNSLRRETHYVLPDSTAIDGFSDMGGPLHHRRRVGKVKIRSRSIEQGISKQSFENASMIEEIQHGQWKRILLLVIAITVHNIPEGLAVGVDFGAIGSSASATFENAR